MDPNETLRLFREACQAADREWGKGSADGIKNMRAHRARGLEYARELDTWVTNGGFLPAEWSRNR